MKSIGSLLCMLISTGGLAQTEKGSFMVGTTLGFSSPYTLNMRSTSSLNLSPNVSYFFLDRFCAGVIIPYFNNSSSNFTTRQSSSWEYSIGPSVRYYFPIGSLAFFPELSCAWGKAHSKVVDIQTGSLDFEGKGSSTLLRAGGGVTYFLSKNFGLEGLLVFQESQRASEVSGASAILPSSKASNSEWTFRLGMQIYLATGPGE